MRKGTDSRILRFEDYHSQIALTPRVACVIMTHRVLFELYSEAKHEPNSRLAHIPMDDRPFVAWDEVDN